ncbi:recombinase family protein [Nesterenkonia xinjiangensis]|uniref:DNA invertase Pin-like site-specific DNA recombinase n=1 Tax=Nesterenkonia xinjiangensis TaxID=225327 RepID=A0A7Z0GQ14_9MICC|nr:recombinase family protein [Nesterenkonia xinjiangensis]NYJ79186.1 DNA invertase Pin-like site-specific DNA recombinase [Nesterenkonia xinjiangensis]
MSSAMQPTPAGIYVRISQDTEDTGLGVKRQRQDCEALAARKGWEVVDVYEDNDVSASKGKPRPAYQRLARDVDAGRVRAVVVWDVDRLTRTPRELEGVIEWAERHGLELASVGGEIDLSTPQGRMTARIKGTVARHEVEQLSRRVRRKHQELAEAGKHAGPRPFGWDITADKRLTINRAEAAVVRECVRRVLAGEGLWSIVNDLTERGVTTPRGGPWQTQPLRRMLLRWRNCGIRTYKGQEMGPGQWEPIIDRETHERVVAHLTDPARKTNNRGTAVRYLLTSIAECGECGRYLVGKKGYTYRVKVPPLAGESEPRYRVRTYAAAYTCPHAGCMRVSRPMTDLDEHVSAVVVGYLEREGVRLLGGDAEAAHEARSRVDALEAKLGLAADQFADDIITGDQFQRITGKLRPQLEAARSQLARSMPADGLEGFAGPDAATVWDGADVEQRRRVLRILGEVGLRIRVDRVGSGNGREYDPDSVTVTFERQEVTA